MSILTSIVYLINDIVAPGFTENANTGEHLRDFLSYLDSSDRADFIKRMEKLSVKDDQIQHHLQSSYESPNYSLLLFLACRNPDKQTLIKYARTLLPRLRCTAQERDRIKKSFDEFLVKA